MGDLAELNLVVKSEQVKSANDRLKELTDTGKKAESGAKDLGNKLDEANKKAGAMGGTVERLTGLITKLAAAFIAGLTIHHFYEEIVKFDSAMANMAKTAKLSGQSFDDVAGAIVDLSRKVPMAADELAKVGEVAGRLGIRGKADLLAFIEPISRLATATGSSVEELAVSMGKLVFITGEGYKAVGPLANVIHELEESSAASAGEIIQAAGAILRTGDVFKATSAEAAALAAMVAQTGARIEFAGGAISDVMGTIRDSLREGGVQAELFGKVMGKSIDEMRSMIRDNPLEMFQGLLDSLHKMGLAGTDVAAALKLMGISSDQVLKVIPALAKNSEAVAAAIEAAHEGMKNFAQIELPNTLPNQLKIIGNNIDALALKLVGDSGLLANFKRMLKGMTQALTGGDVGLAAQIFWATIKLEWEKGATFLSHKWDEFRPIIEELGRRIIQTLGVVGVNAGAALWQGIKNSYASFVENTAHEGALSATTNHYTQELGKIDKDWRNKQDQPNIASRIAVRNWDLDIENKRHAEAMAKIAGTGNVTDDMINQMGVVWNKPMPSSNVGTPVTGEQSASVAAAQAEMDRLLALAKGQATTQPTTMPSAGPTSAPSSVVENWPTNSAAAGKVASSMATATTATLGYGQAINQTIKSMQDEMRVLEKLPADRDREAQRIKAETEATALFTRGTEDWNGAVKASMDAYDKLEQMKGMSEMGTYLDGLKDEERMLYLTNEQREKEVELLKLKKMLEAHGFQGEALTGQLGVADKALTNLDDARRKAEMLSNTAKDVANSFGNAFDDIATGTKTLSQAFQSLASDIERTLIHDLITVQLTRAIEMGIMGIFSPGSAATASPIGLSGTASETGLSLPTFAAHGLVFGPGGITPFARGGLVNRPTLFPFAGGTGLMGEAGPEAIMPLHRNASGDLGVASAAPVVNVTVVNNTGEKVKTTESKGPGGSRDIKVQVGEMMATDIATRGPLAKSLENSYGLKRSGGSR